MNVAYVTTYDSADVHQWSGTGHFIQEALTAHGCKITPIGPLSTGGSSMAVLKAKGFWHNRIWGRRFFRSHDARLAKQHGREVDAILASKPEVDLVLSPGVLPVGYCEDRRPLAIWSDATHAAIFDYYPEYTNLSRSTLRDGNRAEHSALSRCAAAIFSSQWAAESAIEDYGMPASRVHVVPFGANLQTAPTNSAVDSLIERRNPDRCRLLFMGVDWARKGGPLALEIAHLLNREGLPTELTVVGCNPFGKQKPPPFVSCEGFISKHSPDGRDLISALLGQHHFLIVPSRAECYGLVYCEANAFGTPCIATNTGGVPTIITQGENGLLFDTARPAEAYVKAITESFTDYSRYRTMARHARRHFRERLNWDVAGKQAVEILDQSLSSNPLAT